MSDIVTYSFVDNFIERLSGYIEENYIRKGKDLSRLAVVFGGKRPALFVKRALAAKVGGAFYPPRFFSIDEFIAYTLRKKELFRQAPDLDSCYLLYQLAREHTPQVLKGKETFAQFLPWTREILAFIDQLDLENVADKSLENIKANAQIGYPVPDDINRLLENILVLRRAYHTALQKKRVFSRGLQYLNAAAAVKDAEFEEFDEILFCNFFYFNRSEEAVVKNLYERGKAVFLFQGDDRKWPVLERIARHFETPIREGETPKIPKFDLKLHAGFDIHSQAGLVRGILQDIKNRSAAELGRTVVVVPNADHIIPLLSEVTQVAQDFNISLGYPLKRSSLHSLFDFMFQAQLSRKEHRYYAKDYLKVLRHPFVKNLQIKSDSAVTRILVHKVEEILTGKEPARISGSLFVELEDIESLDELYMLTQEMCDRLGIPVNRQELQEVVEQIHELFFEQWEKVTTFKQFGSRLETVLDLLTKKSFMRNYPLNLNIATKMYEIKDEFLQAGFAAEHFPQEELFRIFESKVGGEIVAFHGSPLKGLQILGLFETRSLNFDNVIVMDVNEGGLPRLSIYEPLIPREVMISLNLDRLELEEEIQRYQFMRLISSAKNVHLVYQESREKERSRFVEELVWEVQKQNRHVDTAAVSQASFEVVVAPKRKTVRKTPAMIEALKKHSFSASSLGMYLRNPMDFYYNYVLGLREQEDLLDEPEARQVGTFLHNMIEHHFQKFLGKKVEITAGFREYAMRDFEKKFDDTFGRSMKSDSFLLKTVLTERLNRFWDNEQFNKDRRVEKLLYLEQTFEETIKLSCGDIRFKYIVDRVDLLADGTVLVVDYKTGAIDQMPKPLPQVASLSLSRENIRDTVKSFQLPLYLHFLDKQFPGRPVNAALYNLRTLKIQPFLSGSAGSARNEINDVFLRPLDFVVSEILNPDIDFVEEVSDN